MRTSLLLAAAVLAAPFVLGSAAHATPIFPRPGASTLGPAIIFTFTNSGITTTNVSSQTYDGSDDVFVGIVNNSSRTQTSITLSGSGNGGGIFGFDGDGIVDYIDANTHHFTVGNPNDPTGYAGPGVTFSNISADLTTGTVNFSIAAGGTAYFGLESSPSSINGGGGIVVTGVPEPSSAMIMLAALAALGLGVGLTTRRA